MLLVGLVGLAAACTPTTVGPPSNQAPLAIFSPSVSSGPNPLSVTFDASAASDPDGVIVTYSWDFGDFTTGAGAIVSHTFPAGSFVVTLTVTDNSGESRSSTTQIAATGAPTSSPTGLAKIGSGCCDTYGDFSWNAVPGASAYQIHMGSYFGGGCLTDADGTFNAPSTQGRVQQFGLCLGSKYDTQIRYQANGQWGPWSSKVRVTL